MLSNYIKIAIRSFLQQKYYSLINTIGLALGTSACILILLFVRDELSYESTIAGNEKIYRVVEDFPMGAHLSQSATVPFPVKDNLMQDFPEIKKATSIFRPASWETPLVLKIGDQEFFEDDFIFAEPGFLEIFDVKFVNGDRKKALTGVNEVLLTESAARKYFGTTDPVGKTINADDEFEFVVIGVIEDLPDNTHLSYSVIGSFETFRTISGPDLFTRQWTWVGGWLYFTVDSEADAAKIEQGLPAFVKAHFPETLSDGGVKLYLQKANDIHLTSSRELEFRQNGNIQHVYLFSFIAILIMVIAIINFINLATARASKRAKEVGLRKVMGAHRQMLVAQFIGEAVLTSFLALIIALGMIFLALPFFNELTGKSIQLHLFQDYTLLAGLLIVGLAAGIFAGSYPAFVLSSFLPTEVLKGRHGSSSRGNLLRKALVVSQFVISISLIICIGVVQKQLKYINDKDMGFDKEQVMMVDFAYQQYPKLNAFKSELEKNHDVLAVSGFGATIPGKAEIVENSFVANGTPAEEQQWFTVMRAGFDFEKVLNVHFIEGHSFQPGSSADSVGFIINESAARALGWDNDVVGRKIDRAANGKVTMTATVIGLVKDFHYQPLYVPIKPLVISLGGNALAVKLKSADIKSTIAGIEKQWVAQFEGDPFRYSFMDDNFAKLYAKEDKFSRTIQAFSLLAVFIACLGLLGLSAYATESRKKEIGVRKVNGATTFELVRLLTVDFSWLIIIAFGLSVPVSWYFSDMWLSNFAYRTDIGILIFILAGVIALTLAILTVSYHTFRAARANPVQSLRYE